MESKWQKDLNGLAKKQLSFVAIMSVIQIVMLGLMGTTMLMLSILFK